MKFVFCQLQQKFWAQTAPWSRSVATVTSTLRTRTAWMAFAPADLDSTTTPWGPSAPEVRACILLTPYKTHLLWFIRKIKTLTCVCSGVVNDDCANDADCYNAFNNSACVSGLCACNIGHYPSDDGASCVARKWSDLTIIWFWEKRVFLANAETRFLCQVFFNQKRRETHRILRQYSFRALLLVGFDLFDSYVKFGLFSGVVGDECDSDAECDSVISHSLCTRRRCVCQSGYHQSEDASTCVRREFSTFINCFRVRILMFLRVLLKYDC